MCLFNISSVISSSKLTVFSVTSFSYAVAMCSSTTDSASADLNTTFLASFTMSTLASNGAKIHTASPLPCV